MQELNFSLLDFDFPRFTKESVATLILRMTFLKEIPALPQTQITVACVLPTIDAHSDTTRCGEVQQ
jgi:hypothetical protein